MIIRNYNSNLYFFLGFLHSSKIFFSLSSITSSTCNFETCTFLFLLIANGNKSFFSIVRIDY